MIDLLEYHLRHIDLERCGYGPDEYAPGQLHHHAMAYALYLRGLVTLHRLTGDSRHLDRARLVRDALIGQAVDDVGGLAWGLPFPYRDCPVNHPYAITTAIAGSACLALAEVDDADVAAATAAEGAARWLLEELPWTDADPTVPCYAPGFPAVTHNVTSMVAGFLRGAGAGAGRQRSALAAVRAAQHPLGYWGYGVSPRPQPPGFPWETVADSLHTAYVLDGLLRCFAPTEHDSGPSGDGLGEAIAAGLRFFEAFLVTPGGGLREKVVVARPDEPSTARLLRRRVARAYIDSDHWLLLLPAGARLWSLGAWARVLGLAIEAGLRDPPAGFALADRLYTGVLTDASGRYPYTPNQAGACFPRHEAHLFDGLCTLTLALQGRTGRAAAVYPSAAEVLAATTPATAG